MFFFFFWHFIILWFNLIFCVHLLNVHALITFYIQHSLNFTIIVLIQLTSIALHHPVTVSLYNVLSCNCKYYFLFNLVNSSSLGKNNLEMDNFVCKLNFDHLEYDHFLILFRGRWSKRQMLKTILRNQFAPVPSNRKQKKNVFASFLFSQLLSCRRF